MKERRARVFYNGMPAGLLIKSGGKFMFAYEDEYLRNPALPPISLTFPKTVKEFRSDNLFPFFFGLLAEGVNKNTQCRLLKIDGKDHFTRLVKTAGTETIGAITVQEEDATG